MILARMVTEQEILWVGQSAEGCRCLGSLSLAMVVGSPGEADLVEGEAAGDPGQEDYVAGPDGVDMSTPQSDCPDSVSGLDSSEAAEDVADAIIQIVPVEEKRLTQSKEF